MVEVIFNNNNNNNINNVSVNKDDNDNESVNENNNEGVNDDDDDDYEDKDKDDDYYIIKKLNNNFKTIDETKSFKEKIEILKTKDFLDKYWHFRYHHDNKELNIESLKQKLHTF